MIARTARRILGCAALLLPLTAAADAVPWQTEEVTMTPVANPDDTLRASSAIGFAATGTPVYGLRFVGEMPAGIRVSQNEYAGPFKISSTIVPDTCAQYCSLTSDCAAWSLQPGQPGQMTGWSSTKARCEYYRTVPATVSSRVVALDGTVLPCDKEIENGRPPCAAGVVSIRASYGGAQQKLPKGPSAPPAIARPQSSSDKPVLKRPGH